MHARGGSCGVTVCQLFQGPLLLLAASTKAQTYEGGIRTIQGCTTPICGRMGSPRLKSTKVLCMH